MHEVIRPNLYGTLNAMYVALDQNTCQMQMFHKCYGQTLLNL